MSASRFADLVVSSVLLAGLYATMAYGLSLIYGVLRVVNLAHGGVIMVGAYLAWVIRDHLGLDPYLAIPVVGAIGFGLGAAIYRGLVRRLPRGPAGGPASLLLLFGVWLVLRNIAYVLFTGNTHDIHGTYTRSLSLLGLHVALPRLVLLGVGAAIAVALHLLLRRTLIGRAIRAAAQNADSCTLVGIDVDAIYALTFGIGTALASVAGVLLATVFPFDPTLGSSELLQSFVVVVLGGLGSIYGVGLAALIVAAVEQFSVLILPTYLTTTVGFALLVLVLVLRPGGLFGHRVLS